MKLCECLIVESDGKTHQCPTEIEDNEVICDYCDTNHKNSHRYKRFENKDWPEVPTREEVGMD